MGRIGQLPYFDEGRMEPLQLGLLAAMCPPDVDVQLVDDRCETIPFDAPTDLVAMTVEVFTAKRAYEICAEYRKRGIPVILGGFHPSLIPEEARLHADSIVIGDAEPVWQNVLLDFKAGQLRPQYHGCTQAVQAGILPRRELFRGKGYLPLTLVQFGRGCRYDCEFCAIRAYFHQHYTSRSIDEVVREIEAQDRTLVFFVDDNVVADPATAKQLFRRLIPLRIHWVSQGSVDMTRDLELMDLMVASGCLGNVIGFESIHPDALQNMHKTPNLPDFDRYAKAIRILKQYGLQTWAAFTLGGDQDTRQSLRDTLAFALHHKFTFAAFSVLMPYPGTPLYQRLEAEDRLLYGGKWWLHPDYRFNYAAFKPRHMTPEELTETAFELRTRWNSTASILRRFFDLKTNLRTFHKMAVYWMYNPLFRKETFKKQGMYLGRARGAAKPAGDGSLAV